MKKQIICKRGEIFYANLDGGSDRGSEQGGIRPVIVIQNDMGNRYSPTVIVASLTSQLNKSKLPVHVKLDKRVGNLNSDSIVLLEQIRTLDKRKLKEKIGFLKKKEMDDIDKAIKVSLALK